MRRSVLWQAGLIGLLMVVALGVIACQPSAAAYPTKDIDMVVPWPAGGQIDTIARAAAEDAQKVLGKSINIRNVPGGGGTIGCAEAAKAKPDGYTLLVPSIGPIVIAPQTQQVPYDPLNGFVPVIQYGSAPLVLAVKADSPYRSLKDVAEAAKTKKITYGISGEATINNLTMLLFQKEAAITLTPVPGYASSVDNVTAVVGSHIDMGIVEATGAVGFVQDKKARLIATFLEKRSDLLPDVPTAIEQGYKVSGVGWNGVSVPKGTPKEVVTRLHDAFKKAIETESFKETCKKLRFAVAYLSSEDFDKQIRSDYERLGKVMRDAGIAKK